MSRATTKTTGLFKTRRTAVANATKWAGWNDIVETAEPFALGQPFTVRAWNGSQEILRRVAYDVAWTLGGWTVVSTSVDADYSEDFDGTLFAGVADVEDRNALLVIIDGKVQYLEPHTAGRLLDGLNGHESPTPLTAAFVKEYIA